MSKQPTTLPGIIRRLAQVKPALEALAQEEAELKEYAASIMQIDWEPKSWVKGVGTITLIENTPREPLDKAALRNYLIERCNVEPSKCDEAFTAATKTGEVKSPWKVRFDLADLEAEQAKRG